MFTSTRVFFVKYTTLFLYTREFIKDTYTRVKIKINNERTNSNYRTVASVAFLKLSYMFFIIEFLIFFLDIFVFLIFYYHFFKIAQL